MTLSLPCAQHDDMVDAFTQALNYMRGSGMDWETFRALVHQQRAYHEQHRRGAAPYGQMTNNVRDADAIEYGP